MLFRRNGNEPLSTKNVLHTEPSFKMPSIFVCPLLPSNGYLLFNKMFGLCWPQL